MIHPLRKMLMWVVFKDTQAKGITMRHIRKSVSAAAVGLGALALAASPSFADKTQSAAKAGVPVQLAHMGYGQGGQGTGQPCPGGMMGPGMMAPGMGGQGMMGPGMMDPRMMDPRMPVPGMGGQGMMGPGMMGPGMMGPGMMGPGHGKGKGVGGWVVPSMDLSASDVRHFFEHRLEMHGNKRLKVGEVKEVDDDKVVVDITTVDDSLVRRLEVDRHTGQMRDIE